MSHKAEYGVLGYETLVSHFMRWKDLSALSLSLNFQISEVFLKAQQAGDIFLKQYEEENGSHELLHRTAERYAFACDGTESALVDFFHNRLRASLEQLDFPIHGDLLEERRAVEKYLKEMEAVMGRNTAAIIIRLREAARLTASSEKALSVLTEGHRKCSCATGHDSRRQKPVNSFKFAA